MTALFITGGSGYIGSRLLHRSARLNYTRIYCLQHARTIQVQKSSNSPPIHAVVGDLLSPDTYSGVLTSDMTVLHLAAQTGKAPPDAYLMTNARGTEVLVRCCVQARVRRLVYVSSIAVSYATPWPYHYAESKCAGEAAVRNSGLAYTIVRPTIVVGSNAPVTNLLIALASLPVVPVLGNGTTLVQPIDIEDLVESLTDLVNRDEAGSDTYILGGPQQVSVEALLRGVSRLVLGKKQARVIHLPEWLIRVVELLERFCYNALPVTAGQLSLFVRGSTERLGQADIRTSVPMLDVNGMLERLAVDTRRAGA